MKRLRIEPLWIWSARDILRHPLEALLLGSALAALIAIAGGALLLTQALSETSIRLLKEAPSLVVRRLSSGGWAPLPVAESLEAASSVTGVTEAAPRIWGVVNGPETPVTVIGVDTPAREASPQQDILPLPRKGEAVVGPGVFSEVPQPSVRLNGQRSLEFKVTGMLAPQTGMAAHDLVLLDKDDARQLLGLPPGFASDLAIDVFHDEEESAIVPDLVEAFPWPVRVTTRSDAIGMVSAGLAQRGGIAMMMLLPATLALALLMAGASRDRPGRRSEIALLKALGWTTTDLVRHHMFRMLLICLPAGMLGMLIAYLLVLWPGVSWIGAFLLGWESSPPSLYLDAPGAVLVLIEVAAIVISPVLAATLWSVMKSAAADPLDFLEGGML